MIREYIFFTTEGYTHDPNYKEINNMQILGSAEAESVSEALEIFKCTHSYLSQYAFTTVTAQEIKGGFIRGLELNYKENKSETNTNTE
jgi:hypothetical protein